MYKQMLNNIVGVINCMCLKNYYLINIYRKENDIIFSITDKKQNKVIYQKNFSNTIDSYSNLAEELIDIYIYDELAISKLFQVNDNMYQQEIYISNLEFRFDIYRSNIEDIKNMAQRHKKINNLSQKRRTLTFKKTNPLVV